MLVLSLLAPFYSVQDPSSGDSVTHIQKGSSHPDEPNLETPLQTSQMGLSSVVRDPIKCATVTITRLMHGFGFTHCPLWRQRLSTASGVDFSLMYPSLSLWLACCGV